MAYLKLSLIFIKDIYLKIPKIYLNSLRISTLITLEIVVTMVSSYLKLNQQTLGSIPLDIKHLLSGINT